MTTKVYKNLYGKKYLTAEEPRQPMLGREYYAHKSTYVPESTDDLVKYMHKREFDKFNYALGDLSESCSYSFLCHGDYYGKNMDVLLHHPNQPMPWVKDIHGSIFPESRSHVPLYPGDCAGIIGKDWPEGDPLKAVMTAYSEPADPEPQIEIRNKQTGEIGSCGYVPYGWEKVDD